jgi:hypothetical protein
MNRKILIGIALLPFVLGCGEDPEPPNKPTVTQAQALCRSVGSDNLNKLVSVTVRVQDFDGQADLVQSMAVVEATSLPMEASPVMTDTPSGDCKDADGICVVEFRWSRSPESAQIICGEDGNLLQVEFEVTDGAGFKERVFISSSLQQN